MSSIIEHKKRIREHLEELQDSVNIGLEKRPVSVGFHASACAAEMLEMMLHLLNLISTGKVEQVFTAFQKLRTIMEKKINEKGESLD